MWSACSSSWASPPKVVDKPDAPALAVSGGHIGFEAVRFDYQSGREILRGISFEIPAGHKVAVVGASGAGKSTLARLLFRFLMLPRGALPLMARISGR